MGLYFSNDALTRLKLKKLELERKLDDAYRSGDTMESILLESKYRSISMAIANMRNSA